MENSFRGWYYKCRGGHGTLALIPAVHSCHGFISASIQVITEDGSWNVPIQGTNFQLGKSRPYAALGKNVFSQRGIFLDIDTGEFKASGELSFSGLSPISYDIMGPFCCLPFMECRHSVVSMSHRIDGELSINGREYIFDNGRGYIEGDRGISFPKRYIWSQCLFDEESIMLSAADIPLGVLNFTGVIAVLLLRGKEYRLATYLGARAVKIADREIIIKQGPWQLKAKLLEDKSFGLQAPVCGEMRRIIRENLCCKAGYQFSYGEKVIMNLKSEQASFEYEYPG